MKGLHVCCFSVWTATLKFYHGKCPLHAHCLTWYIRVGCPPTFGRFTHVVADQATQGIDPNGLEKSLENSFDSLVAGKKPWPHWQYMVPVYHGQMSVARPMGWFLVFISDPRAKESEVHGWRQCESLLSSLSSIAAWHHMSCMHLVRASYVPKRKLPYPSACCLYCPSTVCGTRGSREQH